MTERCTWVDCSNVGEPQPDRNGKRWACLCLTHRAVLDAAVASGEPRQILRAWITAQGGPKAAARAMWTRA